MQVGTTGSFIRNLKKLSKADADATISALQLFMAAPKAKALNFEPVRHRAGYFTIRSTFQVRVLLRETGKDAFEAVAVGNHDFIYATYFRK